MEGGEKEKDEPSSFFSYFDQIIGSFSKLTKLSTDESFDLSHKSQPTSKSDEVLDRVRNRQQFTQIQ